MSYTLNNLMQTAPYNEIVVIAGHKGLDNVIHFAGVLDAPDSLQFVQEGELVMTTGYIMTSGDRTLEDIIEELHQRKAAALGIKMFRYLQSVPDSVRSLADSYGLPILFIPNKLSWYDLMFPLMLNVSISDANSALFLSKYDTLISSIRQAKTVTDILQHVGDLLGQPITIINQDSTRALSYPVDFKFPIDLNPQIIESIKSGNHIQLQNQKVNYYRISESDISYIMLTNLEIKDFHYVILWDCPAPENLFAFHSLVYSIILIRDTINNPKNIERNLIQRKNSLLNHLLLKGGNQNSLKREAQDLGINMQVRYSPAICNIALNHPKPNQNSIQSVDVLNCFEFLQQRYRIHSCVDDKGNFHFLIPVNQLLNTPYSIVKYTQKYGRIIWKALHEIYLNSSLHLLIGPVANTWEDILYMHGETSNAMKLLDTEVTVAHIHDLGATYLLNQPELASRLKSFYQEYFFPILELDASVRASLFDTLTTYIETGFNTRETGRNMNVHYNTVRNRLDQFSNLTGLEITQHQDLLTILICFQLKIFEDKV